MVDLVRFMIDIETTCVEKDAHVLEIGILALKRGTYGLYEELGEFHTYVHCSEEDTAKQESVFSKKFQVNLRKKCAATKYEEPSVLRERILSFCRSHTDSDRLLHFMGMNASHFDMEFMYDRGFYYLRMR